MAWRAPVHRPKGEYNPVMELPPLGDRIEPDALRDHVQNRMAACEGEGRDDGTMAR